MRLSGCPLNPDPPVPEVLGDGCIPQSVTLEGKLPVLEEHHEPARDVTTRAHDQWRVAYDGLGREDSMPDCQEVAGAGVLVGHDARVVEHGRNSIRIHVRAEQGRHDLALEIREGTHLAAQTTLEVTGRSAGARGH